MMRVLQVAVLGLLTFLTACETTQRNPDVPITSHSLAIHPVRHMDFWRKRLQKNLPLEARLEEAPGAVLDYLRLDNQVNHFTGEPRAVAPSQDLQEDVRAVLLELPPKLRALLAPKLLGVYVVKDLGSSAATELVSDEQGKPTFAFVAIDQGQLQRKANDWFTWKESSPFKPNSLDHLEGQIETPEHNTKRAALAYVLTHEFAHVISIGQNFHPLWNADLRSVDLNDYPFAKLAWSIKDRHYAPLPTNPPGPIFYYKNSPLLPEANRQVDYYNWLKLTSFATLYAATNPSDDFAESMASFIHTELMNRPFAIRLFHGTTLVQTAGSCWKEARCAAKRKILEELLR